MKKGILKSKMMLIALSSILFVSCGGGGGGGGASNLPLNPGTPSIPGTPGTPGTPSTPGEVANPLDGQKGNMSALKAKLYSAQGASGASIPTDTETYNGSTVKVAILDSDFSDPVRQGQLSTRYPGIEFVPRVNSDTSTSSHGVQVLEVMMDTLEDRTKGKAKFKAIAASIGNGGADEEKKESVNPNLATYKKVFEKFNSNQKVKVINQSFGAEKVVEEFTDDIRVYSFKDEAEPFVPYFENKVNNDGGLFVWAAGNRIGKTKTNPGKDMNSVGLEAGLPYLVHNLEKGWIAAIGIQPVETEEYVSGGKTYVKEKDNGKLNIHREGKNRLAYAGDNAKYWSISADDSSIPLGGKYGVGSSYAAPRVSRAAALVAEKYDWMTPDQVRQTLFTTTDDTELDASLAGVANAEKRRRVKTSPDNKYGWGMLNQERALKGPGAFMNVSKYGNTSTFNANLPAGKTSYFENNIFGDGSLVKSGEGTLHLTNDNSFAGGSIVNKGTLEIHKIHSSPITVGAGGTLVLNPKAIVGYNSSSFDLIGTVDPQKITDSGIKVKNYGNVKFNGNTAIIGGDYVAYNGSNTQVGFKNSVKVLGTIRIQNANISISSNDYITKNETSTVMEGKSFEGNISNVETNGMRTANAEVKDGKVVATLSRQNVADYVGETASASSKNVAENVEKVFEDLDNKIEKGIATKNEILAAGTLQSMSTMSFSSATEVMSGEIYASAQALTLSQAQDVNRDLSNRFSRIDNLKDSKDDTEVWFSALGGAGKLKRNGYASADTRVIGGQAGVDKRFTPTTTLGVALNYSYASADFNKYAGESKSDMVGLSLYGKQDLGKDFYLAARLGVANVSSKVERELLTATGDRVDGKINHHDKMLSTYIELGKKFSWFTPYVGISQDYLRRGSFNESNATWGIKADKKTYRATNFLVGARAEYVADKYKLHTSVSHSINTDKRDLSYEGRFTGSNVRQKYYGIKQAKHTTWLGFGVFREISPAFGVYGNIDFRLESNKGRDSVFLTGIQYRF